MPRHTPDSPSPSDATRRTFEADAALFLGPLPPPRVHSHHAIQGCVGVEGPLRVCVGAGDAISGEMLLIGPDVPHAVSAPGPVAHFYVLPESGAGARLVAALAGRPVLDLGRAGLPDVRASLRASLEDERCLPGCLAALLDLALRGAPPARRGDPRVARALRTLRRSPGAPLADLARAAGLSPDRLRHRIRAETGLPLRRHRRWARLLAALPALRDGGSVTAAAAAAGFADAAHLSRVFRESFTFPPSAFSRGSRFVQARRDGSA